MSMNLFASASGYISWKEELSPGAVMLRGFASTDEAVLLAALNGVIALAPFRHMITPGGYRMSVAMTNCGSFFLVQLQETFCVRNSASSQPK